VLRAPAKTHPDLVGRALALAVLDRQHEFPQWLANDDETDLRLFDLEGIGPYLHWPPGKTPLRYYRASTSSCLAYAQEQALKAGIPHLFTIHLEILIMLDFRKIIDLSGHWRSEVMKRVILRGLEARQRQLRRILGWQEGPAL
jgi:hypothetical protein